MLLLNATSRRRMVLKIIVFGLFLWLLLSFTKFFNARDRETISYSLGLEKMVLNDNSFNYNAILAVGELETSGKRMQELSKLLPAISDGEYDVVLKMVSQKYGIDRRFFSEIYDFWCRIRPESAAKWAMFHSENDRERRALVEKAVLKWSKTDLHEAFNWALTLSDTADNGALVSALFKLVATNDAEAAYSLAQSIPDEKIKSEFLLVLFETLNLTSHKNAFDVMGAKLIGTYAFDKMLQKWAIEQPLECSRWLISYGKSTGQLVSHLIATAGESEPTLYAQSLYNSVEYKEGDHSVRAGLNTLLASWASSRPDEVLLWLNSIPEDAATNDFIINVLGTEVISNGVQQNSWKIPFAMQIKDTVARKTALLDLATQYANSDPLAAFKWADTLEDPDLKHTVTIGALGSIAQTDIQLALDIVGQIQNAEEKESAIGNVIVGWATSDPESATQWALKNLDYNVTSDYNVISYAAVAWARSNPAAALTWIDSASPHSPVIPDVLSAIFNSTSPAKARLMISNLTNAKLKEHSTYNFAQHWLIIDRAAALKWLPESGLSHIQMQKLFKDGN